MGSRRQAREYALQALFDADLRQVPANLCLEGLWGAVLDGEDLSSGRAPDESEIAFSERLVSGVVERRDAIDQLIEQCSTNWRLSRMAMVDRNILRLATFELMACDDIPATVSINEAVELAKKFGTAESKAFVNGLLDPIARSLGLVQGRSKK